jgi:hypothetical protein
MLSEFSEFSYGFALTYELCKKHRNRLTVAPVLPSLRKEGKKGGGYDLKLEPGFPLFLQFKVSDFLYGPNASERHQFNGDYYRFKMKTAVGLCQHQSLWTLDGDAANTVLYAAPAFTANHDLDRFFLGGSVEKGSAFFAPRDIGRLGDGAPHCVAFRPQDNFGWVFSEPKKIESLVSDDGLLAMLIGKFKDVHPITPSDDYFNALCQQISEVAEFNEPHDFRHLPDSPFLRTGALCRVAVGAELFWFSPTD